MIEMLAFCSYIVNHPVFLIQNLVYLVSIISPVIEIKQFEKCC